MCELVCVCMMSALFPHWLLMTPALFFPQGEIQQEQLFCKTFDFLGGKQAPKHIGNRSA